MSAICLGSRTVTVSSPTTNSRSSSRATIFVQVDDDHDDPFVTVYLSNATSAHSCIVRRSNVCSSIPTMAELGRLILESSSPGPTPSTEPSSSTTTTQTSQNFIVAFQHDTNDRIHLTIQQTVVNQMKRTVYKTKMEPLRNPMEYCIAIGETLNQSLAETKRLEGSMKLWKKTAEDLDRVQQQIKDTLLANFTKLRNRTCEQHQTELRKLKEAHETERSTWTVPSTSITSSSNNNNKKHKPVAAISSEMDDASDNKQLLGEDAMALAEGRKLTAKERTRPQVLRPNEAVDMVGILREGQAFELDRNENPQGKRKKPRQAMGQTTTKRQRAGGGGDDYDQGNRKNETIHPTKGNKDQERAPDGRDCKTPIEFPNDTPFSISTKTKTTTGEPQTNTADDDSNSSESSSWILR